jgi:hypothetical protein
MKSDAVIARGGVIVDENPLLTRQAAESQPDCNVSCDIFAQQKPAPILGSQILNCSNLVVVVGAGAAGISAAISAARSGAEVMLLEKHTSVGGTVAHSLIHTLGGLYDSTGEYLNGGQPVELVERLEQGGGKTRKRQIGKTWVLDVHVDNYQALVKCWLDEIPNIKVVTDVENIWSVVQGVRVEALGYKHNGATVSLQTHAVIDTSGVAEVIGGIDPSLLLTDGGHPLAGFIFRLQGVEPGAVSFPRNAGLLSRIRAAVEQSLLPPECQTVWLDKGLDDDEVYAKFSVPLPDDWRNERVVSALTSHMQGVAQSLLTFLNGLPAFRDARVLQSGEIGIREGGRFVGDYVLTAEDVTSMRKFENGGVRAAWPVEYWDPARGVQLTYLAAGDYYEIPLGAMKVKHYQNLWGAGKCLSAEPQAQASARVVGTCWAMGEAVGRAAIDGVTEFKSAKSIAKQNTAA